jgi:SAM-dependent methyltransferase
MPIEIVYSSPSGARTPVTDVNNDALGESLARRRVKAVLPYVRGRLLDVGCGSNQLVRSYGNGIGVDIHPWTDVDVIVSDCSSLDWEPASYDSVTLVASLNHIVNREAVLRECRRVLRPDGQVVITMLTPSISRVWHWLRRPWDADQRERGMRPGEVYGFTPAEIVQLFQSCGFRLRSKRRFMLGLNRLYVFDVNDCSQAAIESISRTIDPAA